MKKILRTNQGFINTGIIKLVVCFLLIASSLKVESQVTINAQLPPAGMIQKEQLWNLILVNNKTDIPDVNIKMSVQDAITGQVVMTANTGSLILGKGVKIITARDIQPIMYNYNIPDFANGYLPMGTYITCYNIYHADEKGEVSFGDECIRINVDPLSPPLLNTPADKSEVETPYPQFTWMPPTPFDMFSNLNYDLLITEVIPGQSATEAIQYNNPVYMKSNIAQPYESYASSFTKLDTGKVYAWQVIARNGLSYEAKTEVWTFKLKNENKPAAATNDAYILLDNNVTGTYMVRQDLLRVKYFSFNPVYTTQVIFTDEKNNIIKEFRQTIVPGDNYLDFNLTNGFQKNKVYKVTITDKENIAHSLTFSINKK